MKQVQVRAEKYEEKKLQCFFFPMRAPLLHLKLMVKLFLPPIEVIKIT